MHATRFGVLNREVIVNLFHKITDGWVESGLERDKQFKIVTLAW